MKRRFASAELYALENNDVAIERAIEQVKLRLLDAPDGVAGDVLKRCKPETHADLINWLKMQKTPSSRRIPRNWSPKRNVGLWLLYQAAELSCPVNPPR